MQVVAPVLVDLALGAEVVILTPPAQGHVQGQVPILQDPAHPQVPLLVVQTLSTYTVI